MLDRAGSPAHVDPLAVSYLVGRGLTESEVQAWTVGLCSHPEKPSLCYAPFERPAASVAPLARIAPSDGFSWGAAGIGAGMAIGIALLLAGAGAAFLATRQNRERDARA